MGAALEAHRPYIELHIELRPRPESPWIPQAQGQSPRSNRATEMQLRSGTPIADRGAIVQHLGQHGNVVPTPRRCDRADSRLEHRRGRNHAGYCGRRSPDAIATSAVYYTPRLR